MLLFSLTEDKSECMIIILSIPYQPIISHNKDKKQDITSFFENISTVLGL